MKVSELKYERITIETISERVTEIIEQVKNAKSVQEVLEAREKAIKLMRDVKTAISLSYMRYTINTSDAFYLAEKDYYDEVTPQIQNHFMEYSNAMLDSPFRAELEKELSPLLFKSFEIQRKAMSPEIISEMIEENRLITEYSNLMSSLTIPFRGETLPLPMLRKYMQDDERATRREAYEALGKKLEEHSQTLDTLYDKLVKVRDKMAKKMGYKNYVELGYYRLDRLGYDAGMVEKFRDNVLRDIVPLVARLKTENAKRLGIEDFKLYDNDIYVPGGNPKPILDKDGIFAETRKMYHQMSEKTGDFIDMMMENEAFDVVSRKTNGVADTARIS